MFSYEVCKIFKSSYFVKHLRMAAYGVFFSSIWVSFSLKIYESQDSRKRWRPALTPLYQIRPLHEHLAIDRTWNSPLIQNSIQVINHSFLTKLRTRET